MSLELTQPDLALDPMAGTLTAREIVEAFNTIHPDTYAHAPVSLPTSDLGKINISILALDLGTKTGYAGRGRGGKVIHGTQNFTARASWTPGQKWQRFRSWLSGFVVENHVTVIAYEDVKNHAGILAAHAYGGFLAMLQMVADQHRIELRPVGVGTVKKAWTGSGSAKKEVMIAQAKARGFNVEDDNAADAVAILHWALTQERAA